MLCREASIAPVMLLVANLENFNAERRAIMEEMARCVSTAFEDATAPLRFSTSEIVELIARVACNVCGVWTDDRHGNIIACGSAVYASISLINHSCYPTAARVQRGVSQAVLALRDLQIGAEISISYVPLESNKQQRQIALAEHWFFACDCARCAESTGQWDNEISQQMCPRMSSECNGSILIADREKSKIYCRSCGYSIEWS